LSKLYVVLIVIGVCISWFFGGLFLPEWLGEANVGEFGDKFGGINALFSGLAFAGVIIAIVLQSKELELQRKELRLTRDVLDEQKEALEEQGLTMQRQRFENTFFQMLSFHNETVVNLKYGNTTGSEVLSILKENNLKNIREYKDNSIQGFKFMTFFEGVENTLGALIKNIRVTIAFIDRSNSDDKAFYFDILKAQLSNSELVLLFYYCLDEENKEYKELVEKYTLFENLQDAGVDFTDYKKEYKIKAFGKE